MRLSGQAVIISFAWTTPALLAGAKTVTRRNWQPRYARGFTAGQLVDAYDRSPRIGGKKVATIRLTKTPYLQPTSLMTEDDFRREGIAWMVQNGIKPMMVAGVTPVHDWRMWWDQWKRADELVYVIEFEVVSK